MKSLNISSRQLFKWRFPDGFKCRDPTCTKKYQCPSLKGQCYKCTGKCFLEIPIKNPKLNVNVKFQCKSCRKQTSLLAGTFFSHIHITLSDVFYIFKHISKSKIILNSKILYDELCKKSIKYNPKTISKFLFKTRELMGNINHQKLTNDIVIACWQTAIGDNKILLAFAVNNNLINNIIMKAVDDKIITPSMEFVFINDNIQSGSNISFLTLQTPGFIALPYVRLKKYYTRGYLAGDNINNVIIDIKNDFEAKIQSSIHHDRHAQKLLQSYIEEFVFQFHNKQYITPKDKFDVLWKYAFQTG
jgi:hypothetical protein